MMQRRRLTVVFVAVLTSVFLTQRTTQADPPLPVQIEVKLINAVLGHRCGSRLWHRTRLI